MLIYGHLSDEDSEKYDSFILVSSDLDDKEAGILLSKKMGTVWKIEENYFLNSMATDGIKYPIFLLNKDLVLMALNIKSIKNIDLKASDNIGINISVLKCINISDVNKFKVLDKITQVFSEYNESVMIRYDHNYISDIESVDKDIYILIDTVYPNVFLIMKNKEVVYRIEI